MAVQARSPHGIPDKDVHLVALSGRQARQMRGVIIDQRQTALWPGRGVVRALALQAVRQQKHEARLLAPALLACRHSVAVEMQAWHCNFLDRARLSGQKRKDGRADSTLFWSISQLHPRTGTGR